MAAAAPHLLGLRDFAALLGSPLPNREAALRLAGETVLERLEARLSLLSVLARLLEQNQLLSAVFIGYPDGQFLLVRPVRNEALRVRLEAPPKTAYLGSPWRESVAWRAWWGAGAITAQTGG